MKTSNKKKTKTEKVKEVFSVDIKTEKLTKCFVGKFGERTRYKNCLVEISQTRINNEYFFSSLWFTDFDKHINLKLDEILELADKLGILDEYIKKHHQ